jgi:hypothetical protein
MIARKVDIQSGLRPVLWIGGFCVTVGLIGMGAVNTEMARSENMIEKKEVHEAVGCSPGMIEDMSVGECVPDERASNDATDRTLAEHRRELANTLLTDRGGTETAAELYCIAAINGDIAAQFALANMLVQGIGVEQDTAEATKWLREAALNGHAMAQVMWGGALINGEGIEADVAEGSRWVIRGMAKWSEEDRDTESEYVGT